MTTPVPDRWLQQIAVTSERGIRVLRAEGVHVWDEDDHKLVDLSGDDGAALLGYAHPAIRQAVTQAMSATGGVHAAYEVAARDELLEMLSVVAPPPLSHAALATSRAEAMEMALACARGVTGRRRVVVDGGWHRSGAGAPAASTRAGAPHRQAAPGDITMVPFADTKAFDAAVRADTAAVLVEPIQWDAGGRALDPALLAHIAERCRETGALLIADEHRSALRTGTPLATGAANVVPDIACVGGGFAAGLPFAAMLTTRRIADRLRAGWYGTDEAGGAVVCAAATATLRVATDTTLAARARSVGEHMQRRLEALRLPEVREVRGRGLLMTVELRAPARRVLDALYEEGYLVGRSGETCLRLSPPLTVERGHVDGFVDALAGCVVLMRRGRRQAVNGNGAAMPAPRAEKDRRQRRGAAVASFS